MTTERATPLQKWRANALWLALLNGRLISMKLFDSDMINRHGEGGREPLSGAISNWPVAFFSVSVPAIPELDIAAERKNVFLSDYLEHLSKAPYEQYRTYMDWLQNSKVSGPLWWPRRRDKYMWIEPVGNAPQEALEVMLGVAAGIWGY